MRNNQFKSLKKKSNKWDETSQFNEFCFDLPENLWVNPYWKFEKRIDTNHRISYSKKKKDFQNYVSLKIINKKIEFSDSWWWADNPKYIDI